MFHGNRSKGVYRLTKIFMMMLCLMGASHAFALDLELTKGVKQALPIAILPFAATTAPSVDLAQVITEDLQASGRFQVLSRTAYSQNPSRVSEIDFSYWQTLKMNNLLMGSIQNQGGGQYQIQYTLLDLFNNKAATQQVLNASTLSPNNNPVLLSQTIMVHVKKAQDLRAAAHQIADQVYLALLGEQGIFTSKLAYISVHPNADGSDLYKLRIADYDGYRARTLVSSTLPLLTPTWSPDGQQVAYVSYEAGHAQIYAQDVSTGQRQLLSDFEGGNFAPAYSKDGESMALMSGKTGLPQLYLLSLKDSSVTQLTNEWSITTSPVFTPDSSALVFVSNRGGQPQIYRLNLSDHSITRLTFSGVENTDPAISPDGKELAFLSGRQGQYAIANLDLASGNMDLLTEAGRVNSPAFSPDSQRVIYTTYLEGRSVLVEMRADGNFKQALRQEKEDVYEPAWSPYGEDAR